MFSLRRASDVIHISLRTSPCRTEDDKRSGLPPDASRDHWMRERGASIAPKGVSDVAKVLVPRHPAPGWTLAALQSYGANLRSTRVQGDLLRMAEPDTCPSPESSSRLYRFREPGRCSARGNFL